MASSWSRSDAYARWFEKPLGRAYRRSIEEVIAPWIRARPVELALDAGCGPILTFVDAFDRGTSVVAVDCSLEMARGARSRLDGASRPGIAVCASVEKLPFASGRFDLVLSVNCLEFVADRQAALAELHRVAAPGARAVIGVLNRDGTWEWTRRLRRPFTRSPYYRGRFLTRRELTDGLAEAGWRVEEVRCAVRFPPLSLRRDDSYGRMERVVPEGRGAVLLARAARGS